MQWRPGRTRVVTAHVLIVGAIALPWAAGASAQPADPLLTACSPNDITTGGGWLLPDTRQKRTFTLVAGVGPTTPPVGRLLFINHITDARLQGQILVYGANPAKTRFMSGIGTVNGDPTAFVLEVTDVGEPGRERDMFSLQYTTPEGTEVEAGTLGGGNIQVRPLCAAAVR